MISKKDLKKFKIDDYGWAMQRIVSTLRMYLNAPSVFKPHEHAELYVMTELKKLIKKLDKGSLEMRGEKLPNGREIKWKGGKK